MADLVQRPAAAAIAIEVLPNGRVRMDSTCCGRPDSRYAPLADAMVPQEVEKLLVELRERLSLQSSIEATPMAESPRQVEITADAVVCGFSGDGLQAAREMVLPVPVVYRAVRLVAAERDWLISLQAAGVISELQLERLAVLQGLLCPPEAEGQHASALDVVDETRRSTLRLQARSLELKAQMVSDPCIRAQLLARSSLAFLLAEQDGCPPETSSEPTEAASGTSGSEGRATDSSRELQLLNAAIAESLLVPGPVARALAQRSGLEDKSLAGTAPSDPLVRL